MLFVIIYHTIFNLSTIIHKKNKPLSCANRIEEIKVQDSLKRGKYLESKIVASNIEITVISNPNTDDYISLTDIAKYRDPENPRFIIQNWMRNRNTVDFLGLWEELNNPNFNRVEFEAFKNEAGLNGFVLTPQKWIKHTKAIGIKSKSGRYGGGTFAHKDIAFEFASWLSPEFKLYVIQDYQRLKRDESHRYALEWDVRRLIAKTNYRVHTDAIKLNLLPPDISDLQKGYIYANEADLLNVALFGMTAAQWRKENPDKKGNIRDYASMQQLLVLSNMENINAMLIEQNISQPERLQILNQMAKSQMNTLMENKNIEKLEILHNQPKLPTDENK